MKKLPPRLVSLTAALCIALFFSCTSNIEPPPPFVDDEPSSPSASPSSSSPVALSSSSFNEVTGSSSSSLGGGDENSSSGESGDGSSSGESGGGSSSGGQQENSSSSSLGGVDRSSESQELGSFDGTYFTDPRDGKRYECETRNGRIWMNENLNYSRGNTLGWCYVANGKSLGTAGADLSGCNSPYGRTYTWSIATDGNSPRGLCPKGWHIPSKAEWQAIGVATTDDGAGSKPMSSAFYVKAGNFNTNSKYTLGWNNRGDEGYWWTSDANRYFIYLRNSPAQINTKSSATEDDYFSIRCVADDGTFNLSSSSGATSTSSSSTTSSNNSSSSATPVCGVDQFCSGAELLWNQTTIQGSITINKCYFTKEITNSNGNSGVGILINGKEINSTNCPSGNLLPNCSLLNSKVDGGYYIRTTKSGYIDITMSADRPPCGDNSSSSGSGQSDEATYCPNATKTIDITLNDNSAQAGTTSAVCFKITGRISGWTASNAQGRTCKANGGSAASVDGGGNITTQSAVNAINGYVYINCSAGNYNYFSVSPYK